MSEDLNDLQFPNSFEKDGRRKKALALATYLLENEITPTHASLFTQEDWDAHAEQAGVNSPSEATQSMVVELMREIQ